MDPAVNVELDSISFCFEVRSRAPTCAVHKLSLLLHDDKFDFELLRLGQLNEFYDLHVHSLNLWEKPFK